MSSRVVSVLAEPTHPWGKLGQLIDRALMYRVAQNTMNGFVERLGQALATELAE